MYVFFDLFQRAYKIAIPVEAVVIMPVHEKVGISRSGRRYCSAGQNSRLIGLGSAWPAEDTCDPCIYQKRQADDQEMVSSASFLHFSDCVFLSVCYASHHVPPFKL